MSSFRWWEIHGINVWMRSFLSRKRKQDSLYCCFNIYQGLELFLYVKIIRYLFIYELINITALHLHIKMFTSLKKMIKENGILRSFTIIIFRCEAFFMVHIWETNKEKCQHRNPGYCIWLNYKFYLFWNHLGKGPSWS